MLSCSVFSWIQWLIQSRIIGSYLRIILWRAMTGLPSSYKKVGQPFCNLPTAHLHFTGIFPMSYYRQHYTFCPPSFYRETLHLRITCSQSTYNPPSQKSLSFRPNWRFLYNVNKLLYSSQYVFLRICYIQILLRDRLYI